MVSAIKFKENIAAMLKQTGRLSIKYGQSLTLFFSTIKEISVSKL